MDFSHNNILFKCNLYKVQTKKRCFFELSISHLNDKGIPYSILVQIGKKKKNSKGCFGHFNFSQSFIRVTLWYKTEIDGISV